MISIIISSADTLQLQQVTENITSTVGVPFEIIATDNSNAKYSICEIYNTGIEKAKYDFICFMHEDVIIESQNWGTVLTNIFIDNPEIGVVGIFGSDYKSFTPAGWHGLAENNRYGNYIQSYKHSAKELLHFTWPPDGILEYVACVDGVWLATKRSVVKEFSFDNNTFNGFHCYDFDFCIAAGQKYKIAVTYHILINHLSEGSYTKEWMYDNIKLHDKWQAVLPVNTHNYTLWECRAIEKVVFREFLKTLNDLQLPLSIANRVLRYSNYKTYKLYWKFKFWLLKLWMKNKSV